MNTADRGRRAAVVAAAVAVMPLAALGTSLVHGIVDQRDAARARAGALQQRLQHQPPPVTVTPAPVVKPSTSPSPSASPSLTGSVTVGPTVIAAGPASGSTGGSGGGGGARPVGGQPPRTPPANTPRPSSSPPSSSPPQRDTCSTVRVAADRPPLGVLACGTVQTTARIGGSNGAR